MFKIIVKGDFREKVDPRILEGFLKKAAQDASGEPVSRVTFHGITRNRVEDIRQAMENRDFTARQ